MRRKPTIWIALAAGLAVSILLFTLFWISSNRAQQILTLLQWPGFFICWLQPGSIESTTMAQYAFIGAPIDGVIYAAIFYIFLRLTRRSNRPLA